MNEIQQSSGLNIAMESRQTNQTNERLNRLEAIGNYLSTAKDKGKKGKIGRRDLEKMMRGSDGKTYAKVRLENKLAFELPDNWEISWKTDRAGRFLSDISYDIFITGTESNDRSINTLKESLKPDLYGDVMRGVHEKIPYKESPRAIKFQAEIDWADEECKKSEQLPAETLESKPKIPWGNWRNIVSKPVSWIRDRKVTRETFKDLAISTGAGFVVGSAVRAGAGLALTGATGLAGAAVIGGVSGAIMGAGREYFKHKEDSKDPQMIIKEHWREIGRAAGIGGVSGAIGGALGFGVASQVAEVIANIGIPKVEIPIPKLSISNPFAPSSEHITSVVIEPSGKDFSTTVYQFSEPDPLFGDKSSLKGLAAGEWAKAYMLDKFGINYFDPFNGVSVVDGEQVHHAGLYERLRDVNSLEHDREVKEIMTAIKDGTLKSTASDPFITNPADPADSLISHSTGGEKTTVKIPKVREVIGGLRRFF